MIYGFTGTRNKPTESQLCWLSRQMCDADVTELHHGACVGADAAAHDAALAYKVPVVVHPPTDKRLMMKPSWESGRKCVTVMPAKQYHARNRDIVAAADRLIALPDGSRREHSGTWYTVDYATTTGVPVVICYPDGTTETRE